MFTRKRISGHCPRIGNTAHDQKGKFAASDYKITLRRKRLNTILVLEIATAFTLIIWLADLTAEKVSGAIYPIENALEVNSEPQILTKQAIIDEITSQANLFGIDPDKAIALAKCESQLDPFAKNPKSTARGLYQYLIGTWEETQSAKNGLERNDYKANIREAMIDLANGEAWRWPDCRLVAGL